MKILKTIKTPMFGLLGGLFVLLALWFAPLGPKSYQIRSEYLPADEDTIYNIYVSCGPLRLLWCMESVASTPERAEKIIEALRNPRGEVVVKTIQK